MIDASEYIYGKSLDLIGRGKGRPIGILDWVKKADYYVNAAPTGGYDIQCHDLRDLADVVDFEWSRFLFASLETAFYSKEREDLARVNGWSLVKRYYAAFYGCHAVLRALGFYVVFVDARKGALIEEAFDTRGLSCQIAKGTYTFDIQLRGKQARLQFSRFTSNAIGTHEIFWQAFRSRIQQLVQQASVDGELGAGDLLERWLEVDNLLSNFHALEGNWLSQVRNDVSYQFAYKVWFPNALPATHDVPINLRELADSAVRLDFDSKRKPVEAFTAACTFLVAIAASLARKFEAVAASESSMVMEMRRMREQA